MENKSKRELLGVLEGQNNKILAYKQKLHDVIQAYKGVYKEKEALESSLKALSTRRSTTSDVEGSPQQLNLESHPLAAGCNSYELEQRVATLSDALTTLTEEKSRIEGCLVADKKKIKQDYDELFSKFNEKEDQHTMENDKLQKIIKELKWTLANQQQQREDENKNHVLMLRELQSLLTSEREYKDKLQSQVDRLKKNNEGQNRASRHTEEYEKTITDLRKTLAATQEKLKISEMAILKPSPLLMELKQEMTDMKVDHQKAVEQEEKRANNAEDNLKNLASASEERVTSLELRVSELSEMLGNYDRLRQQDQQNIIKLKERVAQLDLENMALAQAAASGDSINFSDADTKLDVQALVDRILKLKNLLKTANEKSEFPIDLSDVFNLDNTEPESDIHSQCHQELEQIKEEFETYKIRAQSVLKNKSVKQQDSSKELEFLHRQVSDLKSRLQTLKYQSESSKELHKQVEEKLQETIQEMRSHHRHEISILQSEQKLKLVELEQQMQRQRERTLTLVEEKDEELSIFKNSLLNQQDSTHTISDDNALASTAEHFESDNEVTSPMSDSITDMLSKTMSSKKGEQKILHYVQEIARKDVEIGGLRKARHQTESALRELQCIASTKEEKYVEEIELLQANVRRLNSSQNEEGINMEYLKNVFLRYVLCRDVHGRRHMLNAIAAMLHFTARELEQARYCSSSY